MEKTFKPNIDVLVRIAEAFERNPSLKKTELHLASKVRWNSFVKYLDWLRICNYIRNDTKDEMKVYVLTDSGREMFDKLLKLARDIRSNKTVIMVR